MLTQTAASLAYESTRTYIENHLEYLLKCWIGNDFSVDDFQFQLLDFNSQAAFYQLVFLFAYCLLLLCSTLLSQLIAGFCISMPVQNAVYSTDVFFLNFI